MPDRRRAAILAPGRGSYTAREHGSLRRHASLLAAQSATLGAIDEQRRSADLPSLAALSDQEFRPGLHLTAVHASSLIFTCSWLDFLRVRDAFEIVAVGGNSLGWYTALGLGGSLSVEETHTLILELSLLQRDASGGQLIFPLVGEDWRKDPMMEEAVEEAISAARSTHGEDAAAVSIRLGGYVVLAGSEAGLDALMKSLPRIERPRVTYPLRLAMHGPFHTAWMTEVSRRALVSLANLEWRAPRVHLVDGRGAVWSPFSANPAELREYTLVEQVTRTFDFTAAVRTIVREFAPDALVLLGPGNTLGGPVGQVLAREGYRGIHDRADFEAAQIRQDRPVFSIGLEEDLQAALAARG